jgi:hypothetical protein
MTANKDQKQPGQGMRNPQDRPGKAPPLEKYNAQHAGRVQGDGPESNAAARLKRAESKVEEPSLPEDDA